MLATLRIKNLALVADLTLDLEPGFIALTGETGAGKSILIGALNLILGERADRTLIRSGSESCSVEAVFEIGNINAPIQQLLEENGLEPCENGQLRIKRTLTSAGANRQFVNGSPANLNTLASLGEWLVDIHGPHEHQSLLHPSRQLDLLDAFGGLETDRQSFATLVRKRDKLETAKAALIVDEKTYAQQLDLLRFQLNEISAARLQPDEEAQIQTEHRRSANAAKLAQLAQTALDLLGESDNSLLTQAGIIGRALQELHRIDADAARLLESHQQGVAALGDLQTELSRYLEKIELDPARLQQLEERLNIIQSLKRKYGSSIAEVLAFAESVRIKLNALEQRDSELQRLNGELLRVESEIRTAGGGLTNKRRKAIPQFGKAVNAHLADLGFKQSRLDVDLKTDSGDTATSQKSIPRLSGFDAVEFQFAPNLGELPRPLRAIASSGELARVMLALKTVLAAQDQVPVLVFDEVDANVGGETAHAIAQKMREIARKRQVICITHLPQVAAAASAQFLASKQVKAGRTISEIRLLGREDRVVELARMLGGQTDAARKHAAALLR